MFFYITAWLTFVIDILTKLYSQKIWNDNIQIFWDFLYLNYVKNMGIAFSIALPVVLLKMLTILLSIWIVFYYLKYENKNKLNQIAYGCIVGWAMGNWIERVLWNWVTDFIWVKYFAIFNFADTFLTIGVLLLIYQMYGNRNSRSKTNWF